MSDERKGDPSASRMERLHLCPGSWRLEQQAPPQPESEDATSGTRIHGALAGDVHFDALSPDEQETADACTHVAGELVDDVFEDAGHLATIKERRYWDADYTYSGKPDLVVVSPDRFLVVDYKTGRNEVAEAADNLQIRALIALVFRHHYAGDGASKVVRGFGAIVQPWASPQCTSVEYSPADIQQAIQEVDSIVSTALVSDKRTPGEKQCRYCPAKIICDEFKAWAGGPVLELEGQSPEGITKGDVESRVVLMPGENLARLLDLLAPMKWLAEAASAEAKRRIEASDDAPPGWALKPNSPRSSITDVACVFNRLSGHGVTAGQFCAEVGLTKAGLKRLLKDVTELKGKALDDLVRITCHGCTESTDVAPSLVKEVSRG